VVDNRIAVSVSVRLKAAIARFRSPLFEARITLIIQKVELRDESGNAHTPGRKQSAQGSKGGEEPVSDEVK
jgi:hypothetical protein